MYGFLIYLVALVVVFYAIREIVRLAQFPAPWDHLAHVVVLVLFVVLVSFTLGGYIGLPKVLL